MSRTYAHSRRQVRALVPVLRGIGRRAAHDEVGRKLGAAQVSRGSLGATSVPLRCHLGTSENTSVPLWCHLGMKSVTMVPLWCHFFFVVPLRCFLGPFGVTSVPHRCHFSDNRCLFGAKLGLPVQGGEEREDSLPPFPTHPVPSDGGVSAWGCPSPGP